MAKSWKEWEKPVLELEDLIAKLRIAIERESDPQKRTEISEKLEEFEERRKNFIEVRYSRLGAWWQSSGPWS